MKTISTKDFYLSGYLIYMGFPLKDSVRENGFTNFLFLDSSEVKSMISQYYHNQACVDPVNYGNTLRQLKGVMHSLVSTQNQVTNNGITNKKGKQ